MNTLREYASQTVIASLQVVAVVWGVLGVTAILNTITYGGAAWVFKGSMATFIKGWGFVFLLVPVAWVLGTVGAENRVEWFSKRWTIVTGIILFLALIYFFLGVAGETLGRIGCSMASGD